MWPTPTSTFACTRQNHVYRGECAGEAPSNDDHLISCDEYARRDDAFSKELNFSRYPWQTKIRNHSQRDVLQGTGFAQDFIWRHQNGRDCSKAKFATVREIPNGIGGMLHLLGRALALAIELEVILVLVDSQKSNPWFDPAFCSGKNSWECWFLPLSSCVPLGHVESFTSGMLARHELILDGNPTHKKQQEHAFAMHFVPSHLQKFLRRCTSVKDGMWYYWWLAQATTFILRFNDPTRAALEDLRKRLLHKLVPGVQRPLSLGGLPAGTIALHVRHGDKWKEMQPLPFRQFYELAKRLAVGDQRIAVLNRYFSDGNRTYKYMATQFVGRTLFLSTESSEVVREAAFLTLGRHDLGDLPWSVVLSLEDRTNSDIYTMISLKGARQATLESFLNLELALEADAWVCTLFSNWCMLIDELRMTVAAKASAPYINVIDAGYRRGDSCIRPLQPKCYTML